MPVDSLHAEYQASAAKWKRCRDAIEGQAAVHKMGEVYLPRLTDQPQLAYEAYLKRAVYFNASGRTLDGLSGMVFRKPPVLTVPEAIKEMLKDVDLRGSSFQAFAEQCIEEVIAVGRCGILVDFPRAAEGQRTIQQAEAEGLRPYVALYQAEAIINWKAERIAGRVMLSMVVLCEQQEKPQDDFASTSEQRFRVLRLRDGQYVQEIWARPMQGANWQLSETITPLRNGAPLNFIPFAFCAPVEGGFTVQKPPLLDLVEVNLSHYRTTADLEHGAHFTGLPTAVVSGYTPENPAEKLYVGSTTAWVFPNADAKASFLEFTGKGLGALRELKQDKEGQMAALGARMLAPEKRAVEAAETASIHRAGESSVLAALASAVARSLEHALTWFAEWAKAAGEIKVELNTDYFPTPMTAQDLAALVSAWQAGALSKETLFWNLKQGEIVQERTTFEDEEAAIAASPPGPTPGQGSEGETP